MPASTRRAWRVLIDRGGTFTDVVAIDPSGGLVVRKLLAETADGEDPVVAALHLLGLEAEDVQSVRLGTTIATNAILERRGARIALLTTRGFGDVLRVGTQARPSLFSLRIERPEPLTSLVLEIDERVLASGTVERPAEEGEIRRALAEATQAGCDAVVVAFVHGWIFREHEALAARLAREAGFRTVIVSHEQDPAPGFLERLETAVAEAYVTPPLRAMAARLQAALGKADLRFMTSAGGLVRPQSFHGRDAMLSGPAGGAVAFARVAAAAGCDQAIGLDMGGTSTDVSRWSAAEDIDRTKGSRVAGLAIRAPMVDVVTVAAGGGSILSRIGGRLVAGPCSAGASPGPAAYRQGGPATVTDANIVLGRVQPGWFPACFGAERDQPPDASASEEALLQLGAPLGLSAVEAALGAVRVANEAMARALRQVSTARGRDPREHALVAFGGAAPQHACALADLLGMSRVLVHPLAGVLSAFGMGLADARFSASRAMLLPLDEQGLAVARRNLEQLAEEISARFDGESVPGPARRVKPTLELRHRGVETSLPVAADASSLAALREAFELQHGTAYGFRRDDLPVEIVSARVEAWGALETPSLPRLPEAGAEAGSAPRPVERVSLTLPDAAGLPQAWDVPAFRRLGLLAGHELEGPCLVADATSTIVVDPGWRARVASDGTLDLRREGAPAVAAPSRRAVRLEVFGSRFMGIAEQMGEALRRTAQSPNIKERLDFSCAVFTREGRLVANAPHVPVHLGAMGETVRAILAARGEAGLRRGMAIVSNDPHRGGSHLPDITVVTPVFGDDGRLAFFVANRGHHADVGGIAPGSMPPFATRLEQEGVVLHDVLIVEDGHLREAEIAELLASGPHPVRGIPERLADLHAQAAANATGARLLAELCREAGHDAVVRAMEDVLEDAADATREMLETLPQGMFCFADTLDEGARIDACVTIANARAVFDFTGTSPQVATSLNAPRAVVRACVLYALRCLLARDVPLNDGMLDPVDIIIPPGTLLSPHEGAAVCGGNVETSMRVADVILAALGAQAASQGTMNNVAFGNGSMAFYETIGGGAGAGPDFDGASAVHSHLTNTRLTDVEVLERRAPVIVREVAVRRGSGGAGRHRGGDGMIRSLEFREPMDVSLLTERRVVAAFGLHGGGAGACGRNLLLRRGVEEDVSGKASFRARPGDVLIVATPGGGGWGRKET